MKIEEIAQFYVAIPETVEEASAGHFLGYGRDIDGLPFESQEHAEAFKKLVMERMRKTLRVKEEPYVTEKMVEESLTRAAEKESGSYSTITKRELFAAMAMQGLLANPENRNYDSHFANASVSMSDALIKALEEK